MLAVDTDAWVGMGTMLSLDEYLALPEDARVEIVDGVVRPMSRSDRKRRNVQSLLAQYLRAQAPAGLLVLEEEVVVLSEVPATARIPDVVVFRAAASKTWDTNNTPARDVVLAVEVISPGSATTDRREKPVQYALAGIPGFWLVTVDSAVTVTAHRLIDGPGERRYEVSGTFTAANTVADEALPWAAVPIDDLGRYD